MPVIATVAFRNFKALRSTSVALRPFNLVIGPNGSGKTSLLQAVLRLSAVAHLPTHARAPAGAHEPGTAPEATVRPESEFYFSFTAPHDGISVHVRTDSAQQRSTLEISPPHALDWPALREELGRIRGYVLDHTTMAAPAPRNSGAELTFDGSNVAAVLARLRDEAPEAFSALAAEMLRVTPEFHSLELSLRPDDTVELGLRLQDQGLVTPGEMSQGMLYLLAVLALAFNPTPPSVVCLEDVDRGIHPRLLREIRDALYRLSYPEHFGLSRRPAQVIVTSHSPYFIDLFRDHPEEVIISQKQGRAATFQRLSDRTDLPELLREGNLGDMWFSGILGGVPDQG